VHEDIGQESVSFIGVNLDGTKRHKDIKKFAADTKLHFTTVFDELDGFRYRIADRYGVPGTPVVYVIGLDGRIVFSAIGNVKPRDLKKAVKRSMSRN
jgi:peroxiredoxin